MKLLPYCLSKCPLHRALHHMGQCQFITVQLNHKRDHAIDVYYRSPYKVMIYEKLTHGGTENSSFASIVHWDLGIKWPTTSFLTGTNPCPWNSVLEKIECSCIIFIYIYMKMHINKSQQCLIIWYCRQYVMVITLLKWFTLLLYVCRYTIYYTTESSMLLCYSLIWFWHK